MTAIDRDRLMSSPSSRLEDLLRDVAGFQQFRRSDARSANPASRGASFPGTGNAAALNGLGPAQTSRHKARASLLWQGDGGRSLSLGLHYVSSQFEDDLNRQRPLRTIWRSVRRHG